MVNTTMTHAEGDWLKDLQEITETIAHLSEFNRGIVFGLVMSLATASGGAKAGGEHDDNKGRAE